MGDIRISILRGTPGEQYWQEFTIPPTCETVLDALQWIYRHEDNSLAFRYDCRFKHCGLCGVTVDGRAKLACMTRVEDGMEIGPLQNLPLVRDLVIDRSPLFRLTEQLQLYVVPETGEAIAGKVPADYFYFARCNECLICATVCPAGKNEGEIFGPFVWVRLAQLYLDPRDKMDRLAQAAELGINGCNGCGECSCAAGINFKKALQLLKGAK